MPRVYWLAIWAIPLVELVLVLAVFALVFLRHRSKPVSPTFQAAEHWFRKLAHRKALSVVAVGLATIFLRVALIPVLGIPEPTWPDEFSYLLAADTFAHGRLTNPAHPMWIHFESFPRHSAADLHVEVPARRKAWCWPLVNGWGIPGLVNCWSRLSCVPLCAGCSKAGCPLPGRCWAAFSRYCGLGIMSYWMNEYWCASVVALGGALVLGAWPRMKRHLRMRDAFVMGVGLVVLATSRPYEGLVFGVPFAIAMLVWLVGPGRPPIDHFPYPRCGADCLDFESCRSRRWLLQLSCDRQCAGDALSSLRGHLRVRATLSCGRRPDPSQPTITKSCVSFTKETSATTRGNARLRDFWNLRE